jgi:hypothetical protein
MQASGWAIPLLQSIHIVTIGVVFVSSLVIALRVLGKMRADEPFTAVWARFAPWMWIGLVVMAVTGVLLIVGEPIREFITLSFWVKMALVAIGVVSTALLGRSLLPVRASAPPEFSTGAKTGAVALIVLWLAIIFLGRAIAYDVAVWGTLSPAA